MRNLGHSAALPYCYYDRYRDVVSIKAVSYGDEVKAVSVIYGDPFGYRKSVAVDEGGVEETTYTWEYAEVDMSVKMEGDEKTVWYAELPVPKLKRMKYGFMVEDAEGVRKYYSEYGYQDASYEHVNYAHNHFVFPYVHEIDAPRVAYWAKDTVWYQIFPERFCNGDPSISPEDVCDWEDDEPKPRSFYGGDLKGIIDKLAYIKELGITGIYLNPIFLSPSNHKYDTEDYMKVDHHFGDVGVLKELVGKAHGMGMRVMLDAVYNHIGSRHPFWQDVLKKQEKSKYKDYFYIRSFPVKERYDDVSEISYDTFAFSQSMPKWNTENAKVRKYLIDAATYWIDECDIDGWRLDVADEVSFDFWQEFSDAVRKRKQDFYVVGEVWHNASKWINPGYFDAVMNYPLGHAIEKMFLTNQIDGEAFTREIINTQTRYSELHNLVSFNLLDSHDTRRALTAARHDKLALRNAFTMLLMLPGSPSIYYGTEVGMHGGNDPDCRKPMVWDEGKQDRQLLEFFKELIALRARHIDVINRGNISYNRKGGLDIWRVGDDKESLHIIYNSGKTIKDGRPLAKHFNNGMVLDTSLDSRIGFKSRTIRVYSELGSS